MNTMFKSSVAFLLVFGTFLAPCCTLTATGAENKQPVTSGVQNKAVISTSDKRFIVNAAIDGITEVQLGQLAQQRSANPAVKELAQKLVTDHSKANEELKSVAAQVGVELPTQINGKNAALIKRLSTLSGDQFDKAFVLQMVLDHKKAVNEFGLEARRGSDKVKGFASQTLPTLEEHLKLASNVNANLTKQTKPVATTQSGNRTR